MSDTPHDPSHAPKHHKHLAAAARRREGPIPVAVVTVSDSRTEETDTSGRFLREAIAAAGHEVAGYRLIPDEPDRVVEVLGELQPHSRILIFTGGTGISKRDNTYDALAGRLDKIMPGFGELFRMLSYQEIGAAAMLSRAVAGTYRGSIIISLPGSSGAVKLAWKQLIAPELAHLAWEVGR